jgi:hypothetical protein
VTSKLAFWFLVGIAATVVPTIAYEFVGHIWWLNQAAKICVIVFAPGYFFLPGSLGLPYPWPYIVGAVANGVLFVALAKLVSYIPERRRIVRNVVFTLPFISMLSLLVLTEYGAF